VKRASRWVLRVLAGATLFAMLAGPTPGNVGGCGAGTPVADPVTHCTEQRYFQCLRDHFAGRIDDEGRDICLSLIEGDCRGSQWREGCAPTPAQSTACITLLRRSDLAHLTTSELTAMYTDCNLCM
jgi:hypothetical protein